MTRTGVDSETLLVENPYDSGCRSCLHGVARLEAERVRKGFQRASVFTQDCFVVDEYRRAELDANIIDLFRT